MCISHSCFHEFVSPCTCLNTVSILKSQKSNALTTSETNIIGSILYLGNIHLFHPTKQIVQSHPEIFAYVCVSLFMYVFLQICIHECMYLCGCEYI